MRKPIVFIFIVLFLTSSTVLSQRCEDVNSPAPLFTIEFDEATTITSVMLKDSADNEISLNQTVKINNSYYYQSAKESELPLPDGRYDLIMGVKDLFDNEGKETRCFRLTASGIALSRPIPASPSYGVSPTQTTTFTINTNRLATCKYRAETSPSFGSMIDFSQTGLSTHTIQETLPSTQLKKYKYYIKCKTTDDVINELNPLIVNLSWDSTKPKLTSVDIDHGVNNIVVDLPLETNLIVKTDDPVRCKYSKTKTNYNEMENEFNNYNIRFSTTNYVHFNGLVDSTSYTYHIACENEAELISDTKSYTFSVDLSAAETAQFTSPARYIKDTTNNPLKLTTNKFASGCEYSDTADSNGNPKDPKSFSLHPANLIYEQPLPKLSKGTYTYYGLCLFSVAGKFVDVKTSHTFTVDTTGPIIQNITRVNTCEDGEIGASWSATDDLSGVNKYFYKLLSTSDVLTNWTETTDTQAAIVDLNLSKTGLYSFTVKAVDNAGNEGKEITSQSFRASDSTAVECLETIPPVGSVTTSIENNNLLAILTCADADSGCDTNAMYYGSSLTSTCTPSKKYAQPVQVEPNTLFCWRVVDNAGNSATGQQTITADDTDNDGVPDPSDNCPNTQAGADVDANGCSESQRDSDNDGVKDDIDECPGTDAGATIDDVGCLLDSDDDGMPDDWENFYGFDMNNADDADDDPDNDGFTNLEEYNQDSDPTDPESPGDLGPDEDGDGVSNIKDKCPGTAADEIVDSDGCSESQLERDEDDDGILDDWEDRYCDGDCDPDEDLDDDGLTNLEEFREKTDPTNPDTDSDGFNDGKEVNKYFTDPNDPDDRPEATLAKTLLMIFGIILFVGGAGYVVYKEYYLKPRPKARIQPTPARPAVAKPAAPPKPLFRPAIKPTPAKTEKRKFSIFKAKHKERGKLFESFGKSTEKKEGIKKIEIPVKPKLSPRHITKTIISKAIKHEDKAKVKTIFDKLAKMHEKRPKEERVEAFGKLSQLVSGKDVEKQDIFKKLPSKIHPKTDEEADVFSKLSKLVKGKKK